MGFQIIGVGQQIFNCIITVIRIVIIMTNYGLTELKPRKKFYLIHLPIMSNQEEHSAGLKKEEEGPADLLILPFKDCARVKSQLFHHYNHVSDHRGAARRQKYGHRPLQQRTSRSSVSNVSLETM